MITSKTVSTSSALPGATVSYTITVTNPNTTAVNLDTLVDTLPAGLSYVTGSTTGATTADPAVAGQVLTWNGPLTVAANGALNLSFRALIDANATPGVVYNNVSGTAAGHTVRPSGNVAALMVLGSAPELHQTMSGELADPQARVLIHQEYRPHPQPHALTVHIEGASARSAVFVGLYPEPITAQPFSQGHEIMRALNGSRAVFASGSTFRRTFPHVEAAYCIDLGCGPVGCGSVACCAGRFCAKPRARPPGLSAFLEKTSRLLGVCSAIGRSFFINHN